MLDTEGRSVGPKSGELSVIHEEPSGALLTSSQVTGIERPESKPSLMQSCNIFCKIIYVFDHIKLIRRHPQFLILIFYVTININQLHDVSYDKKENWID